MIFWTVTNSRLLEVPDKLLNSIQTAFSYTYNDAQNVCTDKDKTFKFSQIFFSHSLKYSNVKKYISSAFWQRLIFNDGIFQTNKCIGNKHE